MGVCLATTKTVKGFVSDLKANGCRVEQAQGWIKVFDGEKLVYQALQKGSGGPWMVRTSNSDRITWNQD